MKYFLTVDIGGTDIKYGVIKEDLELVEKGKTETNPHLGAKNIINTIKSLFNKYSLNYKLDGIAISTTSGIDENTTVVTPSFSIKDYLGLNFREELKDLGVNVSAENDVNSMGLCENELVPGHENMQCLIAMTIGTGIGGSIFINGKLFRGYRFSAGEWGKMLIDGDNNYEEITATSILVKNAMKIDPSLNNGVKVFEAYDQGNEEIIQVVRDFYKNLARGLANLIYILNPNHIVIGGGITNRGDKLLEDITNELKSLLWDYLAEDLNITLAKKRNDAGMIGAFINYRDTFLK